MNDELLQSDVAEYARDGLKYVLFRAFREAEYPLMGKFMWNLLALGEASQKCTWDLETE